MAKLKSKQIQFRVLCYVEKTTAETAQVNKCTKCVVLCSCVMPRAYKTCLVQDQFSPFLFRVTSNQEKKTRNTIFGTRDANLNESTVEYQSIASRPKPFESQLI
jgi:hypothetical protein